MSTEPPPYYPEDDRTVVMPRPGGRGPSPPPRPPDPHQVPLAYTYPERAELTPSGLNPLVSAASSLLAIANQLRNATSHGDVVGLRRHILEELQNFELQARTQGITNESVFTGRYVLCCFIDETVLNTVWGSSSQWASEPLTSILHKETSGGERFFLILDNLLKDPQPDLDLLELLFVCLSLGFKGQYRVIARGDERLEELRSIVFEHIRRRRGSFAQELSPMWEGVKDQRGPLRRFVPLWVFAAIAGVLLLSVFFGFTMVLEDTTEPVLEALDTIGRTAPIAEETP